RMGHRQKVSAAASLWHTSPRRLVRLHYRLYPNGYLNKEDYGDYLQELLRGPLHGQPVIVLQDGGSIHQGEVMDEIQDEFPLLSLENLPAYAPELNPVEALWNYIKYDQLANFAP